MYVNLALTSFIGSKLILSVWVEKDACLLIRIRPWLILFELI